MKKHSSLSSTITTLIVLTLGLFFIAFFLFLHNTNTNLVEKDFKKDVSFVKENGALKMSAVITTTEIITTNLATQIQHYHYDSMMIDEVISSSVSINPFISDIFVAGMKYNQKDGIQFPTLHATRNDFLQLVQQTNQDSTIKIINSAISYITSHPTPFWHESAGRFKETNALFYINPIREKKGAALYKFSGFVGAELSLIALNNILNKVPFMDGAYFFTLNKDGQLLTHPQKTQLGNVNFITMAKEKDASSFQAAIIAMLQGKNDTQIVNGFNQNSVYFSYCPILNSDWYLGMIIPRDEVVAEQKLITIKLALITGFVFLLLVSAVYFILQRKTKALKALSESAFKIGEGDFHTDLPVVKSNDEIMLLQTSMSSMQNELKLHFTKLKFETARRQKVESEIKIAGQIQQSFLRSDFDAIMKRTTGSLSIFASLEPASHIGGDFYNYFLIDNKELAFIIGDVSGKGVSASLFTNTINSLFHAFYAYIPTIHELCSIINKEMARDNESCYFATLLIGKIDLSDGLLTYTNAGHPYPYLVQNGDLNELCGTHGPAIGVNEDAVYQSGKMQLKPNDLLLLYTDGITDAQNKAKQIYGTTHLEKCLVENNHNTPTELITEIKKDLNRFKQASTPFDDETIMAIQFNKKV